MSGKGKPTFTKRAPAYSSLHLLPVSKVAPQVAIRVWATKTPDGWTGWLENTRKPGERGTLMPKEWLKTAWKETTEQGAKKALETWKAKQASEANASQAKPSAKGAKGGKGGKASGTAGAKPGVAKTAPVAPKPEPTPPTGTDGPAKPETASLESAETIVAVKALVQAGETLARLLEAPSNVAKVRIGLASAAKPGLAKAKPTAKAPARKRASGKR